MSKHAPRIVFLDAATYGDIPLRSFTDRWSCTVHEVTGADEIRQRISGHSVVVTNKVPLDRTILHAPEARDLNLIAVAATGTDIIDREAAKELNVKVCNVPGYATQSVGQFTMALILELATSVGRYREAVKAGAWQQSRVFALLTFATIELRGKKLGIIGYGNIGKAVAEMGRASGMEILIAARPGSETYPGDRISIEQLFRDSDIVSLHCPLTPQTKNLINKQSLSWMKPTAFLINTARGALVDEEQLIEALRQKTIAAAALDVISREPPTADHPIIKAAAKLDNLIVTPHTAWSTREARERLLDEVEKNIAAFLAGTPRNVVV